MIGVRGLGAQRVRGGNIKLGRSGFRGGVVYG